MERSGEEEWRGVELRSREGVEEEEGAGERLVMRREKLLLSTGERDALRICGGDGFEFFFV